ncbi:hypothetical protein Tsubulata_006022 [Turnera subulata]|uniref:FRIGIDA-like protein n=1 Tax=Turnera subulata TaxID=218843 RepID=A0A9Q0GD09_9ROSI|nr:hypothetical protein Tsubulata_006022 [Turnera subulata]
MTTELVPPITTDRTQKFFDDLDSQKTILTSCTQLFTTLTSRFTSLQSSLAQRSQSLDSKFQSLHSHSQQTLKSLSLRESSIPERESAAAARIEEQKQAALRELENPHASDDLSESLKSFSRRMDASGLLKFVVSKRKESVLLRAEIPRAVMEEAVDPAALLLEVVEELVREKAGRTGITDKRWACATLVQGLFPDGGGKEGERKGPGFSRRVVERAAAVLEKWKDGERADGGVVGPTEAVMFLQIVAGFGLKPRFDKEFLRKLVMEHAGRRDMAKIATLICSTEEIGEIIEELIKNGKETEAVYFASESGLTERFPPVTLLKSYLKNSKKNATTILENGNYGAAATEESSTAELNSVKAIIKCVEDLKLESEFSVDGLKKRASQLEKAKAGRKKGSAGGSAKPQNKRGLGSSGGRGGGSHAFRPPKAAKFSNTSSSFGRRNPAPAAQHSPAVRYSGGPPGPYNYPSQSVYEGPATAPYAPTYAVPHTQSPSPIPQQHYSLPVDNVAASSFRASGSYGGQTNYGAYDYRSGAPTYQPTPYTQ